MSDHPSGQASHPADQAQATGQFHLADPAHAGRAQAAGRPAGSAPASRVLRLLALVAVVIGVLVLAAAAFVLSYPGIHGLALQAGVSPSLSRGYPVIFDAMLVIAGAAVLSLRGGGLVSRCYAWLSLLALLGAAAGADALHSTRVHLPHRTAAAAAAIIPWALVLIGFGLLLALLRHARLHRAAPAPARSARGRRGPAAQPAPGGQANPGGQPVPATQPAPSAPAGQYRPAGPPFAALPPGASPQVPPPALSQFPALGHPQPPAPALPAAPAEAVRTVQAAPSPVPGPAVPAPAPAHASETRASEGHASEADNGQTGTGRAGEGRAQQAAAAADQPDQGPELAIDADPEQDDPSTDEGVYAAPPSVSDEDPASAGHDAHPPAFHRMWSSPTPPGEDYEA